MKRLDVLDGMRGYFLVFMMLNHLSFAGGYLLVKVNHGELGYVQDAQGFVFLSGLLIGMVYAGRMARHGYEAGAQKVRQRAFELYRWALGCVLAVIAMGAVLPQSRTFWEPWLWRIAEEPLVFLGATATLLYQPTYMDILPQYIVYLFVAPPLLWLCVSGRWRVVAIGSALMWAAVQFGLHLPLVAAADAAMRSIHPEWVLRAHFNVFAWQVVFMSGLVIGALIAVKRFDPEKAFTPQRPELAVAALAVVLFFMAFRLGFVLGWVPEALAERFFAFDTRGEFSFVYLLNFAALAYLMSWMLIAAPRATNALLVNLSAVLRAVFTLPFLQLLGRHSLQVYVFHVIVVYFLKAVDFHHGPFNEASKTAIAILAIASLALPALWREWRATSPASKTA